MPESGSAAVDREVLRQAGFDPAASAGVFVGVSQFEDSRIREVPFAVDDAVDLAHLFAFELGLVAPNRSVLALAGEPKKPGSIERLQRLLEQGARQTGARQHDFYKQVSEQAAVAERQGLFVLSVASHGVSDQGGDFVVATDSFADRKLRTGVSVDELLDDVARGTVERRLLLIDTCRERLTGGQRGLGDEGAEQNAAMAASFAQAMAKARGSVLLAGAPQGGFSYDDFERQNGVFTGAILDGLGGRAPADEHGWITPRTLASFVEGQVIEWVRQKRPDHSAKSFGILKHFDGPAESLPLAVDPARVRATEQYRQRRAAALERLKDNLGGILKGPDYDYVEAQLPEQSPTSVALRLLEQIEKLDGSEDRLRLLRYELREMRGELPAPPPPMPETKPPATQSVAAPLSQAEATPRHLVKPTPITAKKVSSWRRWVLAAVVGVAVLVGAVALWAWVSGREKPEPPPQEPVAVPPPPSSEPQAGTVKEGPLGIRFRFIPSGTYTIGSPVGEPGRFENEVPHPVRLTRGFWLGETEVTQGQWKQLVGNNPSRFKACGDRCPVESVSWLEAVAFANKLSEQEGLARCYELVGCTGALGSSKFKCNSATFVGMECTGYRLPSESEWEVAARGGKGTAIYTGALTLKGQRNGPELDPIAWYGGNSGVSYAGGYDCSAWPEKQYPEQKFCGPHPVGGRVANAYGLSDMLGNVWEWTGDWQGDYLPGLSVDPQGPTVGSRRVLRGGSWIRDARFVRAAARNWLSPEDRVNFLGFRLARGQGSAQ